jgi:hypothetical protein
MDPPYRAWLIRDPNQEFLDYGSGRDFHSDELVGLHRLVIAESARLPELALILHSSGDARYIARLPEHIRAGRGPASDPTAGGCSASTSAHSGGRRPAREGGPGTARPQVNSGLQRLKCWGLCLVGHGRRACVTRGAGFRPVS